MVNVTVKSKKDATTKTSVPSAVTTLNFQIKKVQLFFFFENAKNFSRSDNTKQRKEGYGLPLNISFK